MYEKFDTGIDCDQAFLLFRTSLRRRRVRVRLARRVHIRQDYVRVNKCIASEGIVWE